MLLQPGRVLAGALATSQLRPALGCPRAGQVRTAANSRNRIAAPSCCSSPPSPKVKAVREAAAAAGAALVASINSHATKAAAGLLLAGTEQGLKWQARAGALKLLGGLAKRAPAVSAGYFARCVGAVCSAGCWGTARGRVRQCSEAQLPLERRVYAQSAWGGLPQALRLTGRRRPPAFLLCRSLRTAWWRWCPASPSAWLTSGLR